MNTFLVILACLTPLAFLIKPRHGNVLVYLLRVTVAFILFWGFVALAAYRARGMINSQDLYYGETFDCLSAILCRGWVLAGLYLTPFVLVQYTWIALSLWRNKCERTTIRTVPN